MRRAALIGVICFGLVGCGEGEVEVFADLQWSTRCEESGGCPGEQQRDICGFNMGEVCEAIAGAPSPSISCSVSETEETRTISFVTAGVGYSLGITGLVVPYGGGVGSGANCSVVVRDGANMYRGRCGSSAPSMEQPCQISTVQFMDDMGNPTLVGGVLCRGLANETSQNLTIELSGPGSGAMAEMTPAQFRLANCDGLQIEE